VVKFLTVVYCLTHNCRNFEVNNTINISLFQSPLIFIRERLVFGRLQFRSFKKVLITIIWILNIYSNIINGIIIIAYNNIA